MQLPAPMHLWRSTRARIAIRRTPRPRARGTRARSPRPGWRCRAGRTVAPGVGRRPPRRCRARPRSPRSSDPRSGAAAVGVPSRPGRDRPSAVGAGTGTSIGPASSTSSRPIGPVSHRTRIDSSAVPCAMRDSVAWRKPRTEPWTSGGAPAKTPRAAGMMISRLASSCSPAWSASNAAPPAMAAPAGVAARQGDRRERGVGLRAPRRVTGQERQHLLDLRRRSLDELDESRVGRTALAARRDEPGRLDGKAGQGLAPRGCLAALGRHRDGVLQMAAHARCIARRAPGRCRRQVSSWIERPRDRAMEAAAAARSSHRSAPSTSPRSSRVIATPPAARNSIARSPWSRAAR